MNGCALRRFIAFLGVDHLTSRCLAVLLLYVGTYVTDYFLVCLSVQSDMYVQYYRILYDMPPCVHGLYNTRYQGSGWSCPLVRLPSA